MELVKQLLITDYVRYLLDRFRQCYEYMKVTHVNCKAAYSIHRALSLLFVNSTEQRRRADNAECGKLLSFLMPLLTHWIKGSSTTIGTHILARILNILLLLQNVIPLTPLFRSLLWKRATVNTLDTLKQAPLKLDDI